MLWFMAVPLLALYVGKTIFKKNVSPIFKGVRLFLIAEVVSIFMAYILWGQSPSMTYRAMMGQWAILYFFFLEKVGFSKRQLELYIYINIGLYLLLWLYALSQAPTQMFGYDTGYDLLDESRGFFRIFIANRGSVHLGMFMGLNKWNETKNKVWLVFSGGCFVLITLILTRQAIFFSVIIGLYYLFRKNKYILLYLVLIVFTLQLIDIKFSDNSIFGSLYALTESQIESQQSGEEDVRLSAFNHYLSEYTQNFLGYIFGNGMWHSESSYGKHNTYLQDAFGYYYSDVGWGWFFAQFGLLGIFAMYIIYKNCLKKKVPQCLEYAKYYIIFLALYHIASYAIVTDMIYFCIAIYMIDKLTAQRQAMTNK